MRLKKNVKSKFKEKMWCNKELEGKRKLRYYKDVINPNLEDQNYLSVWPSVKKKLNIAKIRQEKESLRSEVICKTYEPLKFSKRQCHQ